MSEQDERGRTIAISVSDGSTSSDGHEVRGYGSGREFVDVSDTDGRTFAGTVDETGLRASICGFTPPSTKTGEKAVCEQLAEYLNAESGNWTELRVLDPREETDIDCELHSPSGQKLEIQVTDVDGGRWGEVARSGDDSAKWDLNLEAAAEVVRSAVRRKAMQYGKLSHMTLALDCIYWRVYAFPPLVEGLRRKHRNEISSYGFAGVYIVGPTPRECARLD